MLAQVESPACARRRLNGLDPDKWFNNVEIVTADKVGIETTTYVRNIFKYYTTYKLMLDHEETQKRRVRRLSGAAKDFENGHDHGKSFISSVQRRRHQAHHARVTGGRFGSILNRRTIPDWNPRADKDQGRSLPRGNLRQDADKLRILFATRIQHRARP
jgi:hypothetical protein